MGLLTILDSKEHWLVHQWKIIKTFVVNITRKILKNVER